MKNLRKISRQDLKSVKGGGIGDCGSHFPSDPPLPGEPYTCECNLYWCEKMGACVTKGVFTPQRCNIPS
ncbi:hypothetical protein M2347_001926 [Chryseobacterium sp. H1D6B]|uniref:bacteriocin-like protein n=1 Tax=Chryseobacterium sp. H1D6B TaxID=2940588 RepID=UPI0015CB80B0|nr:hypothetical protein [Chryseobacterium sp. H1D6B]MDH6252199.1 hypothetical protein [Chryseobacterium sp. H1D6B]